MITHETIKAVGAVQARGRVQTVSGPGTIIGFVLWGKGVSVTVRVDGKIGWTIGPRPYWTYWICDVEPLDDDARAAIVEALLASRC